MTHPPPHPALILSQSGIAAACRPVIDAPNNLGTFSGGWDQRYPAAFSVRLDQARVLHYVGLYGAWCHDGLDDRLRRFKA